MSEWITDRRPTEYDANWCGRVWTTYNGKVGSCAYYGVAKGTPWMPITPPEPYVAPEPRFWVMQDIQGPVTWVVYDGSRRFADGLPTREAAERVAAIYNEVME